MHPGIFIGKELYQSLWDTKMNNIKSLAHKKLRIYMSNQHICAYLTPVLVAQMVKNPPPVQDTPGLIPGPRRSPIERKDYPL